MCFNITPYLLLYSHCDMTFVHLSESCLSPSGSTISIFIFILEKKKKSVQSYIFSAEPLLAERIVTKMEFGDKTT